MALKTRPFDAARYLDSEEGIREYLLAACEDGNPDEIAHALGVIARARGMSDLSKKTGLTRQALYKALSGEGNPAFATVTKVAGALGLRLSITPADDNHRDVPYAG
jgi:probable addiction module antidote protein